MGKFHQDKIIVVDIEATCWATEEEKGSQQSEIIEVGICSLDLKESCIKNDINYIVKPRYSKISKYCTQLTGFTQNNIKSGMLFSDACNKIIKDFGTLNRVWASWGDSDRNCFKAECEWKKAKYPFSDTHINLSLLFNFFNGLGHNLSVTKALEKIGMKFEGIPHRGDDDAYNSARILKYLIDTYRLNCKILKGE